MRSSYPYHYLSFQTLRQPQFSATKVQIFKFRKIKCSSIWRYDKNISIFCQKRAFISSIGAHRGLHSDAFGSYLFQSTVCSEIFDIFIINVFEKLIEISCLLRSLLNCKKMHQFALTFVSCALPRPKSISLGYLFSFCWLYTNMRLCC